MAYYNQYPSVSTGYNQMQYYPMMSASPAPNSPLPNSQPGIIWVDGEVGAKAYQIPAGMTGPVALWDTNDQIIYWKSVNQMGMPNPLQKIKYTIEEQPLLPAGQSSASQPVQPNPDYATKQDIEQIKQEIRTLMQNQNGQQNNQGNNRGGRNNA